MALCCGCKAEDTIRIIQWFGLIQGQDLSTTKSCQLVDTEAFNSHYNCWVISSYTGCSTNSGRGSNPSSEDVDGISFSLCLTSCSLHFPDCPVFFFLPTGCSWAPDIVAMPSVSSLYHPGFGSCLSASPSLLALKTSKSWGSPPHRSYGYAPCCFSWGSIQQFCRLRF